MKLRLGACLWTLCALAAPSAAQRTMIQQLPGRQVFLANSEDKDVAFGLSCDDRSSWRQSQLAAGKGDRFECDRSDAGMWIHINTDLPGKPHKETEQRLQDRGRYQLFWNDGDGKWEVKPI